MRLLNPLHPDTGHFFLTKLEASKLDSQLLCKDGLASVAPAWLWLPCLQWLLCKCSCTQLLFLAFFLADGAGSSSTSACGWHKIMIPAGMRT